MSGSPYVCTQCQQVFGARAMVEERLEYRTLDARQDRFKTIKLRELCKSCASAIVAERRYPDAVPQPEMF